MSFVGEFVAYLKTRTDAPPDFHVHGAMVSLAAALGNRVWCDGWARPIYPNIWAVNIAPSGYGKSTTLDMSQSLLQKAGLGGRVLPGAFSQEALTKRLATESNGVWFHQEFSAFLGTLGRDYNAGAMQWLTEIYDVPEEYPRILMKDTFTLQRPCVSMLGASSPDWFAQAYHESALRGGFLARFIFCPSSTPGAYVGHPGPREEGAEAALSWHLKQVGELRGKANLTPILPAFREWDRVARERLRKDCPPEFAGMRSRAGVLVLKAALLFHVSEDASNLELEARDLRNAIKYVEDVHLKAERYLDEEVAHDKKELQRMRIKDILRRGGGHRTWSDTLKLSKMDRFEFKNATETLMDSGMVRLEKEGRTQWLMLDSPRVHPDSPQFPQIHPNGRNGAMEPE